jgi:glycosyltransferase involved in cell wall biosynthesis
MLQSSDSSAVLPSRIDVGSRADPENALVCPAARKKPATLRGSVTRVLFVSKPISPPFHDGTKCLVRDVSLNLERVKPIVMTSAGDRSALDPARVEQVPIYADSGSFTPALRQNLRAAAWVLTRSRADVWHFVFAPNRRSSQVGRWLKRLRRVPVVQTIASPPKSFDAIDEGLFGDVVVAQSRWTRDRVLAAFAAKGLECPFPISVIPPPVARVLDRSTDVQAKIRSELEIPKDAELFVYPGDLETSRGAEVTAEIAEKLRQNLPNAVLVIAYRGKTPRADDVARRLRARLDPQATRLVSELPDVLSLIASATAVLFPVDDLTGKVDLPIVLLEAMVLGVPVVVYAAGPLLDLEAAVQVPTLDADAWIAASVRLAREPDARRACIERQRHAVQERYAAQRVAAQYEELYLRLASASSRASVAK